MLTIIVRRLLLAIPLLLAVSVLVFLLQALTPGDLVHTILGANYTPEGAARLREQLGLNLPLWEQYWQWLVGALHGDLGHSPISGLDVANTLMERLPATLSLIGGTLLVSAVVGISLGVVSAVRGGWLGRVVDVLSVVGFALPNFWLGLVFVSIFAVTLRLFPTTGYVPLETSPGGWITSLVLPVVTLSVLGVAMIARQTRESMSETLARDFIEMQRAHGLAESRIIGHALRNAAIPIVTIIGVLFVALLSGTVFVESVFALPGLGGTAVQATIQHDAPMIEGVAVLFTLIVLVVNLVVDVAYAWLNPKVRV
jgi:peptide/nickel transport system permease protein